MTDQPTPPSQPSETSPAGQPSGQPSGQPWGAPPPPPPLQQYGAAPGGQYAATPGQPGQAGQAGPVGKIRNTGTCILLFIVTLGIYGWFWYFNTHEEMKRNSGEGIGGAIALILGIFVSIVMVFLTPNEVGKLYERRGQQAPVSALTGLWILLPLAGAIVWFVKTNGALNDYWRSLGAS
jgi:hypothetical protein